MVKFIKLDRTMLISLIILVLVFGVFAFAQNSTSETLAQEDTAQPIETEEQESANMTGVNMTADVTGEEVPDQVSNLSTDDPNDPTDSLQLPQNDTNYSDVIINLPEGQDQDLADTVDLPEDESPSDNGSAYAELPEEPESQEVGWLRTILNFIMDKLSFFRGDVVNMTAKLEYDNESPIENEKVYFYINDEKIGSDQTDSQGIAYYPWETNDVMAGIYLAGVNFNGLEDPGSLLKSDYDATIITIKEPEDDMLAENTAGENLTQELPQFQVQQIEPPEELPPEAFQDREELIEELENKAEDLPDNVEKIEDCTETSWDEQEDVWGQCVQTDDIIICDDAPLNTSCHIEQQQYTYACKKGNRNVHKTKRQCKTTGFTIDNAVKLTTDEYVCKPEEGSKPKPVTLICDSRYDGNGDGFCHDGESCIKFEIDGKDIQQYEKNSQYEWQERGKDKTYFLKRPKAEVIA